MKISVFLMLIVVNTVVLYAQNQLKVFIGVDSMITYNEKDMGDGRISNITSPVIHAFLPDSEVKSDIAVLICPGGGYALESFKYEGSELAEWLSENGITAFVLKYRLPNGNEKLPLEDAKKAIRLIRENSEKWKINSQKIGVIGFSAGGHLAATLLTHAENESMPNFGILFYPVITMQDNLTHKGSKKRLLGNTKDTELINYYSCELNVTKNTPPTLLLLSDNDKTVSPLNSILFYTALKKNNIPASISIFPEGGHGWGFNTSFKYYNIVRFTVLEWCTQIEHNTKPDNASK